jgi:hypothetical protein
MSRFKSEEAWSLWINFRLVRTIFVQIKTKIIQWLVLLIFSIREEQQILVCQSSIETPDIFNVEDQIETTLISKIEMDR